MESGKNKILMYKSKVPLRFQSQTEEAEPYPPCLDFEQPPKTIG